MDRATEFSYGAAVPRVRRIRGDVGVVWRRPLWVVALSVVLIGVAAVVVLTVDDRRAAAVTVTTEVDLRAAFSDPGASEVTFGDDITLTDCSEGSLSRGAGAGALVVRGAGFTLRQTCVGERVITNEGGDLEIRGLTVTGGSLDAGIEEGFGGGIWSAGSLLLVESAVVGNRADGELGGAGGGVAALGSLGLESSEVSGNTAGGGRSVFGGRGGGVYSEGATEIVDSLVGDNTAGGAEAAGGSAGGLFVKESIAVRRSTVAGNEAAAGSTGGGGTFGAAVADGAFVVVNSTVHGNTAAGVGSAHGGINAAAELRLVYAAVTANSADVGSANVLFKPGDRSTASVVAEPLGGAPSCNAPVGFSGGFNFGGDASCGFVAATDQEGAGDPGLDALATGAGGVPVRVPVSGSPLVDAIASSSCFAGDAASVTTDQRGVSRPQGVGCDVGPVELAVGPPLVEVAPWVTFTPERFADTRPGFDTIDGVAAGGGINPAGAVFEFPVAGRGSVPDEVDGVLANVTVTGAEGPGFATAYACGSRAVASTLNFQAGASIANGAVLALPSSGSVCVYTHRAAQVVVDVGGYLPVGSPVVVSNPQRVLETRPGFDTVDGLFAGVGTNGAGETIEVPIAGRGSVPDDATAVFANVTVTGADGAGYATLAACGTRPETSSLNYQAETSIANNALIALSPAGSLCVFTNRDAEVIIDVTGHVPAGVDSVSLIVPERFADTRPGFDTVDGVGAGGGPIIGGQTLEVPVAGRASVPVDAETVAANVTVTGADTAGFATVHPCGLLPGTSTLNFQPGESIANTTITSLSASGSICVYLHQTAHLVIDITAFTSAEPG